MSVANSPASTQTPVQEPVHQPIELRRAVLATVAYHDVLELPLTAVHVWRYLLRPRGEEGKGKARKAPWTSGLYGGEMRNTPVPLSAVEAALRSLVDHGVLEANWGFYFFPGRGVLVDAWIEKHARSQAKWKRLRRIVWWLQAIPFLRGVAGTGSLAFDNAKPSSDLDVLVIAAPGRVWTVRFVLTVLLDLFHLRRRPRGPTKDRVCLNHYLAADALHVPYHSLYTALEYARLVPIAGAHACAAFREANRSWMQAYLHQIFPDTLSHRKTVAPSRVLRMIQRGSEYLLAGGLGNWIEARLARAQRARIARADVTAAPHGRVVATETHAEFHPHSREAPLLATFNARMEQLGLAETFGAQKDSGLIL